MIETFQLKKE